MFFSEFSLVVSFAAYFSGTNELLKCYGYGDVIFLPTMTRMCLNCSENSQEAFCICMRTAIDKYSLTEEQIIGARIPIATNAVPRGNLKLMPEKLVREYALRVHGSMERIQREFEWNRDLKMERYNIQYDKWEAESECFEEWSKAAETSWGRQRGSWPINASNHFDTEEARLKKKKPQIPRQDFEAKGTPTSNREKSTRKYLTRKAV